MIYAAYAALLKTLCIVMPLQLEAAKDALHLQRFRALAHLPRLGLVSPIHPVGGLLKQPAHQGIGGFENGRAHQDLQLGDGIAL